VSGKEANILKRNLVNNKTMNDVNLQNMLSERQLKTKEYTNNKEEKIISSNVKVKNLPTYKMGSEVITFFSNEEKTNIY